MIYGRDSKRCRVKYGTIAYIFLFYNTIFCTHVYLRNKPKAMSWSWYFKATDISNNSLNNHNQSCEMLLHLFFSKWINKWKYLKIYFWGNMAKYNIYLRKSKSCTMFQRLQGLIFVVTSGRWWYSSLYFVVRLILF